MSRRKNDNCGKISVRTFTRRVQGSQRDTTLFGAGEVYQDSQKTRSTEQEALDRLALVPGLSRLHRELIILERIGLNPDSFPDYHAVNRPARPLYGVVLWSWIGKQPGVQMRARDVRIWLEQVERIQMARLRAGLGFGING